MKTRFTFSSFAHYLLGINSQDLMQYVIAEECYASTFPPSTPSPPSSPSPFITLDFTRDRLEEDQGTEALKKIEVGLGGNVQLRLSFSQKATLSLLRKEYAQFTHVAELYVYGVQYLLDGWYREAVVALLSAVKHEQQRRYSLVQNSRVGEILRVLPFCVRRLSSQAAELLANPNPQNTLSSPYPPLRQALELAKLVVIGASVATELKSGGASTGDKSVISPVLNVSPFALSTSAPFSSPEVPSACDPALENTLDLISVWENVASNCSDSSGMDFIHVFYSLSVLVFTRLNSAGIVRGHHQNMPHKQP